MIGSLRQWIKKRHSSRGSEVTKHDVQAKDISTHAISVIKTLQQHHHQAYIVGGAVRDLLLGYRPKDFDVATDASPEEIRKIFRRQSRIIGRRFRIVHIYNGHPRKNEIIEVSTFRACNVGHTASDQNDTYGDVEDDAKRRDYTVNGLFYNPINNKILDYVGGLRDIKDRKLRMIGSPKNRLPEDPLRILRALRHALKLELQLDSQLEKQLPHTVPLLKKIPSARLLDELIKTLKSGASSRIFKKWQSLNIPQHIIPPLSHQNDFFFEVLESNDQRFMQQKQISVTLSIAALFWNHVAPLWHQELKINGHTIKAMNNAIDKAALTTNSLITKRIIKNVEDLFFLQARMGASLSYRRVRSILRHPNIEKAFLFSSLRKDHPSTPENDWWLSYIRASKKEKEKMIETLPKRSTQKNPKKINVATVVAVNTTPKYLT